MGLSSNKYLLIKHENNIFLRDDESYVVMVFDDHMTHIKEHSKLLHDPSIKTNVKAMKKILNHIEEHMQFLGPEGQKKIEEQKKIDLFNKEMKDIINE